MFNPVRRHAFTIIELLVVVSIIALLIGILLPAIGRARDGALMTKSIAQVKQIGVALAAYSAQYNDKHVTYCVDNLGIYGDDAQTAFEAYGASVGGEHPALYLGLGQSVIWSYVPDYLVNPPLDFESGFGSFRIPNAMPVAEFVNGRFYDPVWYAPKDTAVMAAVEPVFAMPEAFPGDSGPANLLYSSYCLSPAAMFNPSVLGRAGTSTVFFNDPYMLDGGFRSPRLSQATYPDLKTQLMEHHWLQNRKRECNPAYAPGIGTYDGCEPYYFNHALFSNPVTLFFDGHVNTLGQQAAIASTRAVLTQTGYGLWSIDTPLGGDYDDNSSGGYFFDFGFDFGNSAHHILTVDGIRGRDVIAGK